MEENRESMILRELKNIHSSNGDMEFIDIIDEFKNSYHEIMVTYDIEQKLALFNSKRTADINDAIYREANGLIVDMSTLEVVCRPLDRIMEYSPKVSDRIDWNTAVFQEKIDGITINLWYNQNTKEWVWSTKWETSITNEIWDETKNQTLKERLTGEYGSPKTWFIDQYLSGHEDDPISIVLGDESSDAKIRDVTFTLELVNKSHSRVVIKERDKIYLISARNNKTGAEYNVRKSVFSSPYSIEDVELYDIEELIDPDLSGEDDRLEYVGKEGYIIIDENHNRLKMTSPYFVMINDLLQGRMSNRLIGLLITDKVDICSMCYSHPYIAHIISFYKYQLERLEFQVSNMIKRAREKASLESDIFSRREYAISSIKEMELEEFGIIAIDNPELNTKELIIEFHKAGRLTPYIQVFEEHPMENRI